MDLLFIVLFLVMLGVLITIHELGHFIAAKAFNVYVFEFAIGFGPKIFRKRKGETYYALRALPLGGYVAMLGEEETIPDEFNEELKEIPKERSLNHINRGKKAVIMAAGITMNLALGYLIFLFTNGVLAQTKLTTALTVTQSSLAASSGLQTGDSLLFDEVDVDGYTLQTFGKGHVSSRIDDEYYVLFSPASYDELDFGGQNIILVHTAINDVYDDTFVYKVKEGDVVNFTLNVKREGNDTPLVLPITLETVALNEKTFALAPFGASLTRIKYHYTFGEAFKATNNNFVNATTAVARGLKSLFTQGLTNVSGPIGIFTYSTNTLKNYGINEYLYLWGLISINLALFNLLPFPPLDGWHLLVTAIEAITRQEISPKFKQVASLAGAVLLIALTIVIFAKDIFFIGL